MQRTNRLDRLSLGSFQNPDFLFLEFVSSIPKLITFDGYANRKVTRLFGLLMVWITFVLLDDVIRRDADAFRCLQ